MKNKKWFWAVIAVIVVLTVGLWGYATRYSTALKANWGLSLPLRFGWKQVYSADSGASPHGDGIRYHVFRYRNERSVAGMVEWSDRFSDEEGKQCAALLEQLAIPSEECPDSALCRVFRTFREDNSQLFLMWDASDDQLYVIEYFL